MSKTGGEIIIETLGHHGVKHVFGYIGGAALPLFDALHTVDNDIELVMTRHEQGAIHMADGYARASHMPSAVIVTSGPGVTNTFTGLMTAYMDNVPVVTISGQVPTHVIGTNAFQETDTTGMSSHITKWSRLITEPTELKGEVQRAMLTSADGRPGPILLDIPKDISGAKVAKSDDYKPVKSPKSTISTKDIQSIVDAWQSARRPIILAGHGVLIAGASDELSALARRLHTPVTTTLLGKGAFPETDELSLGMLGMHGTAYANLAVMNADFALVIGSRFDDRIVGDSKVFLQDAFVAHTDIDPNEIGRIIKPTIGVVGDAKSVLESISDCIGKSKVPLRKLWQKQIKRFKDDFPLTIPSYGFSMQDVIQAVYDKTGGQAIVTTDVGQHQMWAAQFWKTTQPDTWISSGGAGTMGFGFPAAIGAQLARPDQTVIAFVGDGGFQMTLFELATAVRYKLPIKVFVLDNAYLGMVRQWQETFHDNREKGVDMEDNPDFVAIARAYGAAGICIDAKQDLAVGIEEAFAITDRPVIIHVKVNRVDNVYPFIPAGAPYTMMQTGPSDEKLEAPKGST